MIYEYDWYARNEDDQEFRLTFEVDYEVGDDYISIDRYCLIAIDGSSDFDPDVSDHWEEEFSKSQDVFDLKQEIWDYLDSYKSEI